MRPDGSCHCGAAKFRVESHAPYPHMRCYCSICRKTQGGGYAINIWARRRRCAFAARGTYPCTARALRAGARDTA